MLSQLIRFAATAAVIGCTGSVAWAVSDQVRHSCRNDYYTHCPSHAVGSNTLRQCMKSAGPKLSSGCIKALVASGEISQAEMQSIARRLKQTQ